MMIANRRRPADDRLGFAWGALATTALSVGTQYAQQAAAKKAQQRQIKHEQEMARIQQDIEAKRAAAAAALTAAPQPTRAAGAALGGVPTWLWLTAAGVAGLGAIAFIARKKAPHVSQRN